MNSLKTLRGKWGEESFDAAWKNATEMDCARLVEIACQNDGEDKECQR